MDSYGVQVQVLYPNVAVFDAKSIVGMGDTALQLACIEAYNDFLVDFGNEQPGRFIAVSGLPFWDLPATLAEIERCAANGHKGIVFTQDPSYFGLPQLTDRYWDPDVGLGRRRRACPSTSTSPRAISTCSTSVTPTTASTPTTPRWGCRSSWPTPAPSPSSSPAASAIASRTLNFVSVESGIGWIPFALEALDWQWRNCGVHKEHPEYDLLPERVLPPPDLRLLLVRARHGPGRARPDRRRQHPVRDRLPAPHEHVARARPATPNAPTTTSARCSATSMTRRCARSCTTTRRASTTSTDRLDQPARPGRFRSRSVG